MLITNLSVGEKMYNIEEGLDLFSNHSNLLCWGIFDLDESSSLCPERK